MCLKSEENLVNNKSNELEEREKRIKEREEELKVQEGEIRKISDEMTYKQFEENKNNLRKSWQIFKNIINKKKNLRRHVADLK